ncbi:Uma2 family endonuclease [Thiolinea disciformis]|uniref:Uma2 family endonuclease n=1 Tax=Thiolinea disciformis TaxID=125614 RepID=UPI000365B1D0|nr:Uma2 family endonuclease [Thiolinea disciformis]
MSTAPQVNQTYTYKDYQHWPEDEHWELIDGVAYSMTAPARIHQKIVLELGRQISNFLQGKTCEVYVAPFAVRLPKHQEADDQIDTVVEPDVSVICDLNKLDEAGCRGAPDWIIEVLSPSTTFKDMHTKRNLYEKVGVREYWIVQPTESWVMIYLLDAHGQYGKPELFKLEAVSPVSVFPALLIDWSFLNLATQ